MSPKERAQNKYQMRLGVNRGPRQPVNLESLLHPIAEDLNDLAKSVFGLFVATFARPVVFRAGVLNFTTD